MEPCRKVKIIKGGDQQTVINVYSYFKKQFPDKSGHCIVKAAYNATAQVEHLSTE
jgi:hypothetical protein